MKVRSKRASLVTHVARNLDIFGAIEVKLDRSPRPELTATPRRPFLNDDQLAQKSDWEAVGNDIRSSIKSFAESLRKSAIGQ